MQKKAMEFLQKFKQLHLAQRNKILKKQEDSETSLQMSRQQTLNSRKFIDTPRTSNQSPRQFQRGQTKNLEFRGSLKTESTLLRKGTIF